MYPVRSKSFVRKQERYSKLSLTQENDASNSIQTTFINRRRSLPKPNIAAFNQPNLNHSIDSSKIKHPHVTQTQVADRFCTPSRKPVCAVSPLISPALSDSKRRFIESSPFLNRRLGSVVSQTQNIVDRCFSFLPFESDDDDSSFLSCDADSSQCQLLTFNSESSRTHTPRSAASQHLDVVSQQLFESVIEVDDSIQSVSPVQAYPQERSRPSHHDDQSWRGSIHVDEELLYNVTQTQLTLSQPPDTLKDSSDHLVSQINFSADLSRELMLDTCLVDGRQYKKRKLVLEANPMR